MTNQGNDFPLLAKVINGGVAGVIGTTCVFPLDLVKTRLQNQRIGLNGEKMYESMVDCFRKVYRAEGLKGMYRGSAVTILLVTPEKAVKLTANDLFRYYLTKNDGKLSVIRQMLAGALAGTCQIVLTTPVELLKIQLQDAGRTAAAAKAAGQQVQKLTARMLAARLIHERGIFGLYKGLAPTAARDITFSIIYFPLFAAINSLGPRRNNCTDDVAVWWPLIGGLFAGSFAAVAVTPMDVIKTRMQIINQATEDQYCIGFVKCVRGTYTHEGLRAFFKGGLCRMMVLAPLFGIAQLFYLLGVGEAILDYFRS